MSLSIILNRFKSFIFKIKITISMFKTFKRANLPLRFNFLAPLPRFSL